MKSINVIVLALAICALIASGCVGNDKNEKTLTVNGIPVKVVAEKIKISAKQAQDMGMKEGLEVVAIEVAPTQETEWIGVIDCQEQPSAWAMGICQGPLSPNHKAIAFLLPIGIAKVSFFYGDEDTPTDKGITINLEDLSILEA